MEIQHFYLFLLLAVPSFGYDFIREAFKNVDQLSDPCDNFYRHACPLNLVFSLIAAEFHPIVSKYKELRRDSIGRHLEFMEAVKGVKIAEVNDSPVGYIVDLFQTTCESGLDTQPLLERIQAMAHFGSSEECKEDACLSPLSGDTNCTRAASNLEFRISATLPAIFFSKYDFQSATPFVMASVIEALDVAAKMTLNSVEAAGIILDADLRDGVEVVNGFINDMLDLIVEWVEETPWVNNQGIENAVKEVAKQIHLENNYGVVLRDSLEHLMSYEFEFLKCTRDVPDEDNLFCLLYVIFISERFERREPFFNYFNARNYHPELYFGFPLYHIAGNAEELAAKLGSVGVVAGHEVSHSFIEDHNTQSMLLLPTTSAESNQCIQRQYNATCNEFKEDSCFVADNQIDENGADILGMQLAHQLFENIYGSTKDDVYLHLHHMNVTYHQLFFYASAFSFCSGFPGAALEEDPHSTTNIRINVFAQHPAFKEAFNCPADSRMVRTFPEQCVIFGKDAPEQKRRRKFAFNGKNKMH